MASPCGVETTTAQTSFMVARALVNPAVSTAVGRDPRGAALGNPHHRDTMASMVEKVTGFWPTTT